MARIISFIPENDVSFQRGLDRLAASTDDFRIPFRLIANEFFQSNKKLFTLGGPGLYQDLAPAKGIASAGGITTTSDYKEQKEARLGFAYPILRGRTQRLENSLTKPRDKEAVNIVKKNEMELGTDTPYAIYHQSDRPRSKLPQRKVIFIDGGPAEIAKDAEIAGRTERWLNIINDHVVQLITGEIL